MSKYNATPSFVDGIRFASRAEASRYTVLRLMEQAGLIKNLELQPKYELIKSFVTKSGEKVQGVSYLADFRYLDLNNNRIVTEDVKGVRTPVYLLKRKMLLQKYPDIHFMEVTR